jgi:cell division protease FtsH
MWLIAVSLIALVGVSVFTVYDRGLHRAPDVPFSDLLRRVDQSEVASLSINGDRVQFTTSSGQTFQTLVPLNYVTANPSFVADLAKERVRIDVKSVPEPISYEEIAMGVALLGVVGFLFYRVSSGRALGLDHKLHEAGEAHTRITFDDVAGVDEAKEEVAEVVDFLRAPQRFAAIGGRIPKGVLLVGPPGTGKTLLARSIAGEAKVPFLFASGSDFVEMYAGVGAKRIRKLFKEARRHRSCIIFIDELDAVGRSRGGASLSHEEREQTLNQLLVEMDGFAPNAGVVVIAATNRPDILDAALLRPGRFDRQVSVGTPDLKGREQILKIHARSVALEIEVNLRQIARGTPGFSGAELANLVNEAALCAVRRGRTRVCDEDFDQARDKILMGAERRSLAMSDHERTTCAYHEAGHAVIAALLPHADPLHKVTIIPRGRALGVTMQVPVADRHTQSREYLDAQLTILMGGRVAEELFFNQMTSGAKNDIERATEIARRMVCEFGMSVALGPLAYPSVNDGASARPIISEATAQLVDHEIRDLVVSACERARQMIGNHRRTVQALADELLAVESLDADGIKAVIANAA